MKLTIAYLVLSFSLAAHAQTPTEKPPAKPPTENTGKVDAKLHGDVLKLLELSGVRERVDISLKPMVEKGRKEMMEQCPKCAPEFGDEWAKRMLARLKADDFLNVYVQAYEKHFTDEEITELIDMQRKKNEVPPPSPSPQLKEKLNTILPTLFSEIIGGCAQVGAKLGGEIGEEIGKEHPEYLETKSDSPKAN